MKVRPMRKYCTAKKLPDIQEGNIIQIGKADKSRVEIVDVAEALKEDLKPGDIVWLPKNKANLKIDKTDLILVKWEHMLAIEEK